MSKDQKLSTLMPHKSEYYPSVRNDSCCGKGKFDSRFEIVRKKEDLPFWAFCCGFFCRRITHSNFIPDNEVELERLLPIRQPNFTTSPDKIRYTWIGHSTAVISIGGKINLLIDPVFAQRASPFQWAGPARYRKPACKISELPPIHAVFISHDHYDHLDQITINELQALHKPLFCAGLDSAECFPKGSRFEEFDWTDCKKLTINGEVFEVTFVPVAHQAQRWLCDKNTRLWGGFVIRTPQGKQIFYSGDTAYCNIFKEIGDIFGPFDLGILPIGAYEPRHLLQHQHVNPEESVRIHKDIRSKKSVGVHWGTFPLGLEDWYAPKKDFQIAKKKHDLADDEFVVIEHGTSLEIDL